MQKDKEYRLRIDFQDGFDEDTVVININEKEVYRNDRISTDYSLSYAAHYEEKTQEGRIELQILIPTKCIERSITLEIKQDSYLGISVLKSEILIKPSKKPFVYF